MRIFFGSIFIIFFTVYNGCRNPSVLDKSRWNGLEVKLTHEVLEFDQELLTIKDIVLIDSGIIIKGATKEGELSLFRQNGNVFEYVSSFMHTGRGPNEMLACRVYYVPESNSLAMMSYNPNGKSIFIPLDNLDNLLNVDSWSAGEKRHKQSYGSPVPINNVDFIALNFSESSNNIFLTFTNSDSVATEIPITFPESALSLDLEKRAFDIFSINYIVKRPFYNQFVYCFQNGHFAEIFELGADNKSVVKRIKIFDQAPEFDVRGSGAVLSESAEDGFRICVTEDYIYLSDPKLKHGEYYQAQKINGYKPGWVKEIYVSDWKGSPIIKYITEIPVGDCKVDKNNEYLYASTYDPDTFLETVVRFKLPEF